MNRIELHEKGTSKFVVMQNEEGYLLISHPNAGYHRDIVRKSGQPSSNCIGGGRISVDEKEIHAYGYSVDFGEVPSKVVEMLLKEHVGDKNITVKVNMGEGY